MQTPFLIGPRLYFRPLERGDARKLVTFLNDPGVRRTLLFHRPMSTGQEEGFLEAMGKDEHQVVLGIARHGQDELIGSVGLHKLDFRGRHAEFGLLIGDRSLWGQGFGTEATRMMLDYGFGTLNLNRIWLQVFASHVAGQRVYEKAGFRKEGLQREQHFAEGRYEDGVLMGILRSEWTPLTLPRSSGAQGPDQG